MDINRILVEYAKLHLQLLQANDIIAALQAQLRAANEKPAQTDVAPQ